MKLIEEIGSQLPIAVYPTKDLASYLSQNGRDVTVDTQLMITKVFDSGYEGGIICLLEGSVPEAFVISITLLKVKPDHPLFDKISAYQKRRIRSIFRSKGLKPRRSMKG